MTSIYIRGWKGLAEYTGYHWKTLQRWHYSRVRLPFVRTKSHTTRSRWIITPDRVHVWLMKLGEVIK